MARIRTNIDRMDARMAAMQKLAEEGSAEALDYLRKANAEYDKVSATLKAAAAGAESIARTVIDDLNPLVENVIEVTNLPALAAQTIIRVFGALRPTKQQATETHEAFCEWRAITKPATRDLIDALETSFDTSITRWIGTLEDEPAEPQLDSTVTAESHPGGGY